jgi:hypothetical protein
MTSAIIKSVYVLYIRLNFLFLRLNMSARETLIHQLDNVHLFVTDTQALDLWEEMREFMRFLKQDFSIFQIENSHDGKVDTNVRDDLFCAFAYIMTGMSWPLNQDTEEKKKMFTDKLERTAIQRSYTFIF